MSRLKIVAVSDLHFGSSKISPEILYQRLQKYFYPEIRDAHLVVIAGDLYDQLLTVGSAAHRSASRFVADLFQHSAATGCQIRILHGTYSHDRDQLSVFSALALPNTQYKIYNEIACEQIDQFRCGDDVLNIPLRIGYIPDNLSYKRSSDVIDHLQQSMTCCGYKSLDVLIGHGSFDHTLPKDIPHKPPCLYTIDQFKDIVTGPIIMGHIHVHSKRANVYYCGSFDRLAHGEEENKGFYVFTRAIDNVNDWQARFVTNPEATPFITLFPKGKDPSEVAANYLKLVAKYFPYKTGYVRVVHASPEIRTLLHRVSLQHYPEVIYSSKSSGLQDSGGIQISDLTLDVGDEIKPDIHNLTDLVCQYLTENNLLGDVSQQGVRDKMTSLLATLKY